MKRTIRPGGHVLIVDDDRTLRLAVASLLNDAGYTTDQAEDGPEALHKLQQRHVDLMLLDIGLPGMNGLEVLEEARRLAPSARVVMMTADDTPHVLLRSFRS